MKNLKVIIDEGFHQNTSSGVDSAKQQVLDRVQVLFDSHKYNPDIKKAIVNDDLTVDVDSRGETVCISGITEDSIGVKFNKITGGLVLVDCKNLKTLEGCPDAVSGVFGINRCDSLKSLVGGPKKVGKPGSKFASKDARYYISNCKNISSLDGGPRSVAGMTGSLDLYDLPSLKSLAGLKATTIDNVEIDGCDNLIEFGDNSLPKNMRGRITLTKCSKMKTLDCKKTQSIRGIILNNMDQFTIEDVLGTNYNISKVTTSGCKQIEDMSRVDMYDLKNK